MNEVLVVLYSLAALSSAFNMGYFSTLQTVGRNRRLGAAILALVSAGALLQSVVGGLNLWLATGHSTSAVLLAQSVVALGSLAVTGTILRRLCWQWTHHNGGAR